MTTPDYDLVIIGGGYAGMTAGTYAARARLNVLLIEKLVPGGQILITDWIENYPGFPEGISGMDLAQKIQQQAERFGLKIENGEVTSLDLSNPIKKIILGDKTITSHTLIIASGASPPKTRRSGRRTFLGKRGFLLRYLRWNVL